MIIHLKSNKKKLDKKKTDTSNHIAKLWYDVLKMDAEIEDEPYTWYTVGTLTYEDWMKEYVTQPFIYEEDNEN